MGIEVLGSNNEAGNKEVSVLTATQRELAEQMKTWDFARTLGYAMGILSSGKYFSDAVAKQVRADAAYKIFNIAWKKHLKER